jgi:hypothetical protein
MVKYNIDNLYKAKITKKGSPDFALSTNFISKSEHEFIFSKEGDTYTEVFTQTPFNEIVEDIATAKSDMVLISPQKLRITYFKKDQRENKEVSLKHIIPVYRTINEPKRKLIKSRKVA